jgi:hypothetical protein
MLKEIKLEVLKSVGILVNERTNDQKRTSHPKKQYKDKGVDVCVWADKRMKGYYELTEFFAH